MHSRSGAEYRAVITTSTYLLIFLLLRPLPIEAFS